MLREEESRAKASILGEKKGKRASDLIIID
jgi:hypothetical protein